MNLGQIRSILKVWMLPIAMMGGIVFHNAIGYLSVLSPYLIGIMLFITYCRLNIKEIRITRLSGSLIIFQIFGSLLLYFLLLPFGNAIAQAAFICVFCPTATAAPVITGMLGGSVPRLVTYSLVSNFAVAILAPVFFTLMDSHGHSDDLSFWHVTALISLKVIPLILGPLALAQILKYFAPRTRTLIAEHQNLSFYIWAVSLFIVVGNAVSYVISHIGTPGAEASLMISISLVSLFACCAQFYVGRKIGIVCGDKIAGAQGLGQKNTVLAIWMALSFLNPVSSIGPAAYVAWQNTINSIQLWLKSKKEHQLNELTPRSQ